MIKSLFGIYKKGQGVWARSVGAAALSVFLLWGCAVLYNTPARTAYIGSAGDVLDAQAFETYKAKGVKNLVLKDRGKALLAELTLEDRVELSEPAAYDAWWIRQAFAIPFVDVKITQGHVIVGLLLLPGAWVVFQMVNRRKNADFLIETEAELKKVSWSTKKEVIASSKVVAFFVVLLAVLLLVYDQVYKSIVIGLREIF